MHVCIGLIEYFVCCCPKCHYNHTFQQCAVILPLTFPSFARCSFCCVSWYTCSIGYMGALKMTDMKMTDRIAVHENAGHEIAGHKIAKHDKYLLIFVSIISH